MQITHDVARSAFLAGIDGRHGELHYSRLDAETVAFDHTFVPIELRGHGIAERLVTAGMRWAREQKLRVVPACSYVSSFMDHHPEWNDLRALRPGE
jgi:predicted GNAT family acetyltransferase